jgi:hypothetical protein
VVEWWPNIYEALGSIPSTTKERRKKEGRREQGKEGGKEGGREGGRQVILSRDACAGWMNQTLISRASIHSPALIQLTTAQGSQMKHSKSKYRKLKNFKNIPKI